MSCEGRGQTGGDKGGRRMTGSLDIIGKGSGILLTSVLLPLKTECSDKIKRESEGHSTDASCICKRY